MSSFFEPAIAELWNQIQRYPDEVRSRRACAEDFPEDLAAFDFKLPMGREDMARAVGADMARAWLHKREAPGSLEALRQEVLGENPAWAERMIVAYRCKRALEIMSDTTFSWRDLKGGSKPQPGQFVLYFFDAVGSHPGYFVREGEVGVYCNLFAGFLGGDEVTLWMPMPGMEEEISFEVECQTQA